MSTTAQNNSKSSPIIIFSLVGVLIVAGIVGLIYTWQVSKTKSSSEVTEALSKGSTYANTDYFFTLNFTNDWQNYLMEKQKNSDVLKSYYKVWIQLPSNDDAYKDFKTDHLGYFNPINIDVILSDQWEQIKNKGYDNGIKPKLLGNTGSFSVVYYINNDQLIGETGKRFRNTLIPQLAKTFQVIK